MSRNQRLWTRRGVSWTMRTLIFVGLMILIGQRVNYFAAGIPGSGWVLLGTVLFAVGMMGLAAQMEAAVDRREGQVRREELRLRDERQGHREG